jgi:hypothetical protein
LGNVSTVADNRIADKVSKRGAEEHRTMYLERRCQAELVPMGIAPQAK